MADEPPSPTAKLRLFLDVTILIKAVSFPRLPFEIVRLGARRDVSIVLSAERIRESRGLCRDEDDIGVALAAIDAAVDYLVLRTGVSLDT
jgi:predicted nucleic acid-binding protein